MENRRVPLTAYSGGPQIGWATLEEDENGIRYTAELNQGDREELIQALADRGGFSFWLVPPDDDPDMPHDPLAAKPPVIRRKGQQ